METTTKASRRQPPASSCPSPPVPAPDTSGGAGGGVQLLEVRGATATLAAAGTGGSRALWDRNVWVVVAWLSITTVFLLSGACRPPLAFVSAIYRAASPASHPHQHGLADASHPPLQNADTLRSPPGSADNSTAPKLPSGPSMPHFGGKFSDWVPHNPAAAAPSAATNFHRAPSAAGAGSSSDPSVHDDKLLDGLLAAGFDEGPCLSRYQSYAYAKESPFKPSPYLLQRLREYEALHRRCGPPTSAYKRSLGLLKAGSRGASAGVPCKYVVWDPENGLGNRILSIASAFLYALLSQRVLLVIDWSAGLDSLLCEPFPGSTWLLPQDFPLRRLPFSQKYSESYGDLLKWGRIGNYSGGMAGQAFVYVHLSHDYDDYDKRFYCEADQLLLEKIPWMALRSDQYFVPALFLNRAFEGELVRLFPEKEAVFHHLGRYLFHPSNEVWDLITRYYRDHLAGANERLGVQIRVFDGKLRPFHLILRQIINCTLSEKLLPEVDLRRRATPTTGGGPSKAVLLASLHSVFYHKMKGMYSEHPATGGEAVSFHQPSHEEEQRTGSAAHDGKALAEMYLLSMADALVTSSRSTFGYVAQGLAGATPWVLLGPVHESVPEPSCVRDLSPEPCFHFPPNYDCETGARVATTKLLPFTRRCRDFRRGIKLVACFGT
ncbi:hypothetical protein Taro_017320 [Colocasia esculenta]|uniref:Fucosyltransferase n=1 Tax=Colocasia esculenta TaxID=4460 RepID=A0A843UNA8_COLES|nr:hypothetical protein [Colocasia esculenta]